MKQKIAKTVIIIATVLLVLRAIIDDPLTTVFIAIPTVVLFYFIKNLFYTNLETDLPAHKAKKRKPKTG